MTIREYTTNIALRLKVVGLINIQYAIYKDKVYILEANPRASRTVPLVSKVCNIQMAKVATQLMMGKKISELGLKPKKIPHFGVKEAVFPFNMFPEVDPVLGPEMRSTGEVLGLADSFGLAFFKAEESAGQRLPTQGSVLITLNDEDKLAGVEIARRFKSLGFNILATQGTYEVLSKNGIPCQPIKKLHEGRPNIVDAIMNNEVQLVINTPVGRLGKFDDSYIRKSAIKYKVPYITTISAAFSATEGIDAYKKGKGLVKSLQKYHQDIK